MRTNISKVLEIYPEILTETIIKKATKHRNTEIIYNFPVSFDIETSSWYEDEYGATYTNDEYQRIVKDNPKRETEFHKRATMYIWQMAIKDYVFYGRSWEDWKEALKELQTIFDLPNKTMIVWVHNLSYEFQWIRKHLNWDRVFSTDSRKPVEAVSTMGFTFRCSYMLSNMSLENVGKNLVWHTVKKKVGNLDYSLIRNSLTPLTAEELDYCTSDVLVVNSYIEERIKADGNISKIPLTNTGYVRNYCRFEAFNSKERGSGYTYRRKINQLKISGVDEYERMHRAFQGGFTHASALHSGELYKNVASFDFTSSYPTVLIAEQYPMSPGFRKTVNTENDMEYYTQNFCCLFDIEFIGIEPKLLVDHPISKSKCQVCEGYLEDNGRIVSAKRIITTITDVDYKVYKMFYKWEKCRVSNFTVYRRGYLPTPLVKSILHFYEQKTELKGIDGREDDYLRFKGMLNSAYGMMVQDVVRADIDYTDDWEESEGNKEVQVENYNKNPRRFLFYLWGIFCTAYARRNLFWGIREFSYDYIYSDTDSLKVINHTDHMGYIEKYNNWITDRLKTACDFHEIDHKMIHPKNNKGVEKPLGVWDFEGVYDRFKCLGAKRYMVEKHGKVEITIAGVSKKKGSEYMNTFENPFDEFCDEMYFPPEWTGKSTLTYIDYATEGNVTDYMGNTANYSELSSVHMETVGYSLGLAESYKNYLSLIRKEIVR